MTGGGDSEKFQALVRRRALVVCEEGCEALGALFDITANRLLRFAVAITGDRHLGEDAIQSVFVSVATRPWPVAEANSPWAYLLVMTRNQALALLRKHKRTRQLSSLLSLKLENRVDQFERYEVQSDIWDAIGRLPSEQSEVVVLKIWEGMTFSEIAELLELPLQTIASRYRYALRKLESQLGETSEEANHV